MKKSYILLLGLSTLCIHKSSNSLAGPTPEIEIIRLADGFAINAHVIHQIMEIAHDILTFYKKPIGTMPINEFADLEKKYIHLLKTSKITEEEYQEKALEIERCLVTVLDEIFHISAPFAKIAEKNLAIVTAVIREWVKKTGRHASPLIKWIKSNKKNRGSFICKKITSFSELDTFLTDMLDLLSCIIKNCPLALEQFRQSILKKEE